MFHKGTSVRVLLSQETSQKQLVALAWPDEVIVMQQNAPSPGFYLDGTYSRSRLRARSNCVTLYSRRLEPLLRSVLLAQRHFGTRQCTIRIPAPTDSTIAFVCQRATDVFCQLQSFFGRSGPRLTMRQASLTERSASVLYNNMTPSSRQVV
jgi:hypothetical protein